MTEWKEVKRKANLDPERVAEAKAKLIAQIKRYKQLEEWENEHYAKEAGDD